MATAKVGRIDVSGISRKVEKLNENKALGRFAAMEAMGGMDRYVPFRDGALVESAKAEPFEVTYNTPYAATVYYGVRNGKSIDIKRDVHIQATKEWDKAYKAAHGHELAKSIERFIERGL